MARVLFVSVFVALAVSALHCKKKELPPPSAPTPAPVTAPAAAKPGATPPSPAKPARARAPDAAERFKKFAPTVLTADLSSLSAGERAALVHLRRAADAIDRIFWKQSGEVALSLRAEAQAAGEPIAGLYRIHYGPWDGLDHHKPFFGDTPRPPGAGFYPADLTKEALAAHLAAHPADKAAFESPYTIVARQGKTLVAVPYSKAYAEELREAATALRAAADKVPNASLQKFLRSRAAAFESNDYFESDCDWMDVEGKGLDVTIGPYEVYADELAGQKASFEAIIGVRDEAGTAALQLFKQHLPMLDAALPVAPELRTRRAAGSPLVVIDKLYAGGDGNKGVPAIAFNLPNDEKVRAKKGSKKVMLKNVTAAKFERILRPIATRLLDAAHERDVNFDTFFRHALMHEVAHGMGPGVLKKDGREVTVNQALKELYSAIEEAKADIVGLFSARLLMDKGLLPASDAKFLYPSYLASMLRSIRFGAGEAHGRANLLQLGFLEKEGAITFDDMAGRFGIDAKKMPDAVRKLAAALLDIEGRGDYTGAQRFLAEHAVVRPHLEAALKKLADVPVDIAPTYPSF